MRPPTRLASPDAAAHLRRLLDALSNSAAYPHEAATVEVHQTHISIVFLAGPFAYKIKKPVDLAFVDYHTLDRRHHFCHEEVRLNRRLAPEVYRGVVPIVREASGAIRVGSVEGPNPEGQVIEWAVCMERLPAEATLAAQLERGRLDASTVRDLARRIAAFHDHGATSASIAAAGRFAVVSHDLLDNFTQTESAGHVGRTLSAAVFERLRVLTLQELGRHHSLIEDRADRGVPRDTHGDLRLDHAYVLPLPRGLTIVDCVEFNDHFRHTDPVADAAFPVMELSAAGRRDLAYLFAATYFAARGDDQGRALLPLYVSYRAAVRGKVGGLLSDESEVPELERAEALSAARGFWLLALDVLEDPARRPALILLAGLPGVGKSTLAGALAQRAGCEVLRSDVTRKELAAGLGAATGPAAFGEGIYARFWTERTYSACLDRARSVLFEGKRVVIDASFGDDSHRRAFLNAGHSLGVRTLLLHVTADRTTVEARLMRRRAQRDASDADLAIHDQADAAWQPFGPETSRRVVPIDTSQGVDAIVPDVLQALERLGCL